MLVGSENVLFLIINMVVLMLMWKLIMDFRLFFVICVDFDDIIIV